MILSNLILISNLNKFYEIKIVQHLCLRVFFFFFKNNIIYYHIKNVIGTRLMFYSIKKFVPIHKNMIKHFVCVNTTYSDELNNLNLELNYIYIYI
jgi:hypothetical protein